MGDSKLDLDWLVSNYGEFLGKFAIDKNVIDNEYSDWLKHNDKNSPIDFLLRLFRKATLHIIKNAATQQEYYNWKLELDLQTWEFLLAYKRPNRNYYLEQIHFDKLMISYLTSPSKFLVQIDSNNCCPYCLKKN